MTTTLTVDERQTLIARCYVALAEVDHDLAAWSDEAFLLRQRDVIRRHVDAIAFPPLRLVYLGADS